MALAGAGPSDGSDSDSATVTLPEPVELALIIASLTSLDLESGNSINRSTSYFAAVENHFGPYREHPAISALPTEFNLPRLVGNAADFAFDDTGALVRVDTTGSLWGDDDGNSFALLSNLIADFARKTDYRSFYEDHRADYEELIAATEAAVTPVDMRKWLDANFSASPRPIRIYVSPLMSRLHWTTLYKPEQRIWISPPGPGDLTDWSNLDRMRFARSVFTELDHAYVNPVTTRSLDDVSAAFADAALWGDTLSARGYSSAELKFNEYMTWAVFLMYASDRMTSEQLPPLVDEVVSMMADRRGFREFDLFEREALARYQEGSTAEEVQLRMIAWASEHMRNR